MAEETNNPLIKSIDEQLSLVRSSIRSQGGDERIALEQFEIELTDWSNRLKRGHEDDSDEQPSASKRARRVEATVSTTPTPVPTPTPTPTPARDPILPQYQCSVCLENLPKANVLSIRGCKCRYCGECLAYLLQTALDTNQIARCCNHNVKAPKALKTDHAELCSRYETMFKELGADNPFYCTNASCSTFLGNFRRLKHKVTCKACGTQSCAGCRRPTAEHKGIHGLCPEDVNNKMMQTAVATYHMNRCPNCFVVVEKNGGCNNVKCKCGTLFCYVCGEKKRTEGALCACAREARLAMPDTPDVLLN